MAITSYRPGHPVTVKQGGGGQPSSVAVTNARELQEALDAGETDITLTQPAIAPANGINVPRLSGGRTLRCSPSGILTRGPTLNGHVLRSDGTGGSLTLVGFRVDGGWRQDQQELTDLDSNYYLPDYTFLRLENCVTCYSKRTGFLVAGSTQVEIAQCTAFAICRDFVWADRVRDLLVEDCLVQHCGDDGLGTHQSVAAGTVTFSVIFRRNTLRDSYGVKAHCGAASGTYNGKQSQLLVEDNVIEAPGLYGVHFHEISIHNTQALTNVTIRRNVIRDCRLVSPVDNDVQSIGVAIRLAFPNFAFDSTCVVQDNLAVRTSSHSTAVLQDVFDWGARGSSAKPANVPGAGAFEGFFTKTGFLPARTFRSIGSEATLFQGSNTASIVTGGNTFTGDTWANTVP